MSRRSCCRATTTDDAASLFGVACVGSVVTAALCAVLLRGPFQRPLRSGLHWQGVPGWPWLLALVTFLGGMTSALGYWHSRRRSFGRISWARVIGSAASTSYQLGAGALGQATPAGLVNGSVSGLRGDSRHARRPSSIVTTRGSS